MLRTSGGGRIATPPGAAGRGPAADTNKLTNSRCFNEKAHRTPSKGTVPLKCAGNIRQLTRDPISDLLSAGNFRYRRL